MPWSGSRSLGENGSWGAARVPLRHDDAEAEAPPPYNTSVVRVLRLPGGDEVDDRLAVEEPLELRIGGTPVAVTMRTPGHDEELASGSRSRRDCVRSVPT